MFLKKIILKNFKSFKGKTILEFPFLITAIIGPNGSGKSNIIDALRWALGEQSFKNIRADKGQDLIFAGSEKDTSAAFCEVELIFDNQKKIFNSEYIEISILRRIDKDGNNSYFLNHKACRLKDIIDLTASAKVGLKGFSIINQGSVENILLVSPQERRIMLEEALGLKNIELKKEETKRKLEETDINLDKTVALEKEILPHLRSLKRQVNRWEKREKIREDLSEIEKKYFANIYHSVIQENLPKGQDLNSLNQNLEKIDKEIQEKENKILLSKEEGNNGLETKVQNITQEIIALQNQKSTFLRELGRQEANPGFSFSREELEVRISNIKNQLEPLLEIKDLFSVHKVIKEIIDSLNNIFSDKGKGNQKDINKIQEALDELEKKLLARSQELKKEEEEINEKNKGFRGAFEEITKLRSQKEELLKEIQKEELLLEKYKLRLEDFKRRVEEAGLDYTLVEEYYQKNKNDIIFDSEKFILLERQVFRLKREIAEIGTEDVNVMKEYQEVSKRYEFLSQQIEDLQKGSQDLKILIQELTQEIEKNFEKSLNEINKDFNRYFRLIFSGGSAKLEQIKKQRTLSEEQYWGVDIRVDIPKTELKSLEMLSGGEKTLAAVSLLFAIVNQSDPPLVVVDEIDAALDEDNSQRFSQILKELYKNTQFIIITHNRTTMTVAEVIYGVTIGEDNSSQLLSIKLEESERLLEQK
ncbi:MAG: AAA family ATPase [Candidatus Paceibacterota bacterium]|jgi:chromosome segregation protein